MRRATPVPVPVPDKKEFQSTLSMRRATGIVEFLRVLGFLISIHALHEESDCRSPRARPLTGISIHALHEESDWSIVSDLL